MAQRVSQLPDIAMVRGITRPKGAPLEEAKLSYQAGEVGGKLSDASKQIAGANGDLDALTTGSRKLADALAAIPNANVSHTRHTGHRKDQHPMCPPIRDNPSSATDFPCRSSTLALLSAEISWS